MSDSVERELKGSIQPEPVALTVDQQRRGQRWIIVSAVTSILFWTGISDRVISLFILGFNPSTTDTTLAFFFALGPLTAVLTALASPWVARRGKKRMMVPFYLVGLPFLIVLAVLPSLGGLCTASAMVTSIALSLTGYYVFRSLGMAGWFPIINDNVPDETRGRFSGACGRAGSSWSWCIPPRWAGSSATSPRRGNSRWFS